MGRLKMFSMCSVLRRGMGAGVGVGVGGQCEAEQNLIDLAVVLTTNLPCVLLPIIL